MHEVQALYLRHLSAAAETRYVDGAIAVRTGILSNTENGVVSTTAELDRRTVHGLIEWLGDVPASWIALSNRRWERGSRRRALRRRTMPG